MQALSWPSVRWATGAAYAAELPRANPRRDVAADAPAAAEAPALAASSASLGPSADAGVPLATRPVFSVPFPLQKPGAGATEVIGTAQNDEALPVAPTAFAPTTSAPVASLFDAAEAAAQGTAPPASPIVVPAAVASIAATEGSASIGRRDPAAFLSHGVRSGNLKSALDALKADRYEDALARRNGLKDPIDRTIVDYFLVRSGASIVTSAMVTDFAARAEGWPKEMIRSRLEAALLRDRTDARTVVATLCDKAGTPAGARALGRAHLALGQKSQAQRVVRTAWRNMPMGGRLQRAFAEEFSTLLTAEAHLDRADRLIGKRRYKEAEALRLRLGKGPRTYLEARLSAARGENGASKRLSQVPKALKRRAGYSLALAETKHREDEFSGAARLIEKVQPDDVVDGDGWWTETRIVARALAEHPDLVKKYLGSVVPKSDNFYATLNSAVFSD
ncbi:MAG: hypothetical protein AAGF49_16865, partial [Pseudomonadota bacterium]